MIYRNRAIINQRGGTLEIDNTTNQEKVHLSHRSGSNININSNVASELATNNKQTNVLNDKFETVKNDDNSFVGKNRTVRVGRNNYELKGFKSDSEIQAFENWKELYRPIADLNSQFKIKRGGESGVNGVFTPLSGTRAVNPVLDNKLYTVENIFNGYSGTPYRIAQEDQITNYTRVVDYNRTFPAEERNIEKEYIEKSAGETGSKAPGVMEFGGEFSAATENGEWELNEDAINLELAALAIQDDLTVIEQQMGDGGDEVLSTKKNRFEQIGASFNDLPALRIDEKGRSQPFEVLVSDKGTFKNHDYIPHVEEVDNSSNFPCGEDHKIVCNRYVRTVGSGGISQKTTGSYEIGGTVLTGGFKKITLNASHGIHIGSERGIEIQSLKTIVLRTNRQVYVESSLGVKNNLIVGGGLYVEGETYLQHVTAPLEVQQTQDTTLAGQFATLEDRKLFIGECEIGGTYYPVYAKATPNLIINYPHGHHFHNIPLTMARANSDVRQLAQLNNINSHDNISVSLPQVHERKLAVEVGDQIISSTTPD